MKDAHNKAAEHHESAAKSHRAAAESHGKNDHAKGKEHATQAQQQHAQNAGDIPRPRMQKAPNKNRKLHREAFDSFPVRYPLTLLTSVTRVT